MSRIYLASSSKARKKLLQALGVKFKVLPSRAQEDARLRGRTYCALVKDNARAKAREVAVRIKSGVVIAADTITV